MRKQAFVAVVLVAAGVGIYLLLPRPETPRYGKPVVLQAGRAKLVEPEPLALHEPLKARQAQFRLKLPSMADAKRTQVSVMLPDGATVPTETWTDYDFVTATIPSDYPPNLPPG